MSRNCKTLAEYDASFPELPQTIIRSAMDAFENATSQLSFNDFIETMKNEQAKDLVRAINLYDSSRFDP
jgi:hypothetical protein